MTFIILLLLTAFLMEGIGSYISVVGLGALFASDLVIMIMAVILDIAKVMSVSFLYQFWKDISRLMKYYMTVAVLVLVMITSVGAFGYLSAAFQKSVQPNVEAVLRADALKLERDNNEREKKSLTEQRAQINLQIANIPIKANEDPAQSVRNRQRIINAFKPELQQVTTRLNTVTARSDQLSKEVLEAETASLALGVHTGPIIYVAKAFAVSIEDASKWIIMVIISVFDPLAVMLVISGNFLIKRRRETPKEIKQVEVKPTDPIQDAEPTIPIPEELVIKATQPSTPSWDWRTQSWIGNPKEIPPRLIISTTLATAAPTTEAPTTLAIAAPTTAAPTEAPTTAAPTEAPTIAAPTLPPELVQIYEQLAVPAVDELQAVPAVDVQPADTIYSGSPEAELIEEMPQSSLENLILSLPNVLIRDGVKTDSTKKQLYE